MKERITAILKGMGEGAFEREEVLALSLLASLAGESIFLLGLPGTGKSMVARRLKRAFKEARSFEYLMSRFSTPDEIFGPVSISKLKDEDVYERITQGYLPEADIVFLDEIWKAGPAIQNALLTVLNEKTYLNGNREMYLPVKGIIAASNELPAEGEGLEALWDRFLIRYVVEPLKGKENFARLLLDSPTGEKIQHFIPFSAEELMEMSEKCKKITISPTLIDLLYRIREKMNKKMERKGGGLEEETEEGENLKYYISDRRWKKGMGLMKMSAFLNGRTSMDFSDLLLLRHILWNDSTQTEEINALISEEIVNVIFKDILAQHKSTKRHASSGKAGTPFSPDKKHYLIQCDGFRLKIAIEDYKRLKKSGEYRLASEAVDETLVLIEHGQYAVQVLKEGYVSINSFSYPLVTEADREISEKFLMEMGDSLDSIVGTLTRSISSNLFVKDSSANSQLLHTVRLYQERLEQC